MLSARCMDVVAVWFDRHTDQMVSPIGELHKAMWWRHFWWDCRYLKKAIGRWSRPLLDTLPGRDHASRSMGSVRA